MENSIESIWKEGFLQKDALIAPKLNNLYDQKSTHLVDKFKRMFKINLLAILIGSILFLIFSIVFGIPIMGIGTFIILISVLMVNRRHLPALEKIDKNQNSYEFIKAFHDWLAKNMSLNKRMAHYYYPLFFLSMVFGFWFSTDIQELFHEIISNPNQIFLINGFPVLWTIPVFSITILLAFFGGKIYYFDIKIVYGRVLSKLDDLLTDMEELRS